MFYIILGLNLINISTSFLHYSPSHRISFNSLRFQKIDSHLTNIFQVGCNKFVSKSKHDDYAYASDYDDDDDDEPPPVDISKFKPPILQSSPSQRKAMGKSGSGTAKVHVCSHCGSEFVKWMGKCPTCNQWNTLQEVTVQRDTRKPTTGSTTSSKISNFGKILQNNQQKQRKPSGSWLNFDSSSSISYTANNNKGSYSVSEAMMMDSYFDNRPRRITDVLEDNSNHKQRLSIPYDDELNNILGGGIMMGSLTLLGGDPGVGKSTLLIQIASHVASLATPTPQIGMGGKMIDHSKKSDDIGPVWYISGEETTEQIASRASRLGIRESELMLLSETHVDTLAEQLMTTIQASEQVASLTAAAAAAEAGKNGDVDGIQNANTSTTINGVDISLIPKAPSLLIVDSIQTMMCDSAGTSHPGGVTQMRECVALLLRLAKSTRIPIIMVGHVTKSGAVAGPRTVEHMVDCVLYLEGCNDSSGGGAGSNFNLRVLRASKNRFGSCDEVGVYEMNHNDGQLVPVSDPSSLLLSQRLMTNSVHNNADGCSVTIILEGVRAMTVEIQALVTPSMGGGGRSGGGGGGYSRITVNGVNQSRLNLLIAVLQKRCKIFLSGQDVFVNVVGQMKLDRGNTNRNGEGGTSDLAIAMALVSSLASVPVRSDTAFIGEVGLLGELRPVSSIQKRLQEAKRMGFSRVVSPRDNTLMKRKNNKGPKKSPSSSFHNSIGIEWIQCDTLVEAINAGLEEMLQRKTRQKTKVKKEVNGPISTYTFSQKEINSSSTASKNRIRTKKDVILDDEEDDEHYDNYDIQLLSP